MFTRTSRLSRPIFIVVLGLCLGQLAGQAPAGSSATAVVRPAAGQTPADFLDLVGSRAKTRWRLLFRPPPPTPPSDRTRATLILGSLLGESFLVLQAADSQQFRNNNQDVLAYCRTLGLGEKLMPRLMAQGKMAEDSQWKELRQEIVDDHREVLRLLREQKDDDLALMIDLGLWLRVLEISSTIAVEAGGEELRPLCIGSPALLQELRDDIGRLSTAKREEAVIKQINTAVEVISAAWKDSKTAPTENQATQTREKLKELLLGLMEKPQS